MRASLSVLLLAACGGARHEAVTVDEPRAPPPSTSASTDSIGCTGRELELEKLIFSSSCTIAEADVDALPTSTPPKLEASVLPDRRVLVKLTNTTAAPLTLVFAWHSAVDAFPGQARPKTGGDARTLVAASASLAPATGDLGQGWHYARAVLDPGGNVSVRLSIDEHVETVDYAGCPPNAKCSPNKTAGALLANGTYTLRLGVPLRAPRMDDPSVELEWSVKR